MPDSSSPSLRVRQKLITRESVLAAARSTIRKLGFQRTTIREIARAANVSVGTVMNHAKCKEDLLFEAFHGDIEQIAAEVFQTLPADSPLPAQLAHIGGEFLRQYAAEPELYADFLEHSLLAGGEWGGRFTEQAARIGARVGQLFVAAMARGEISAKTNVRAAVTTFFSLYYFALLRQVKHRFAGVDAAVGELEALIEDYCRGLRCEKSS